MTDPTPTAELLEQLLQHVSTVASRLDHMDIPSTEPYTRTAVRREARKLRDIVSAVRAAQEHEAPTAGGPCQVVEIDDEPILVQGTGRPLSEVDVAAIREFKQVLREQHSGEQQ
ncbi:hypothetical protein [Actinomadura sp. 21ATH]|uniref:hypothetical protein n=1 Tax=Actinomadura sp. 21ATH TaxID=1735444 RepID=UPI0035BF6CEC